MPTATLERPNVEPVSPERLTANFADFLGNFGDLLQRKKNHFVLWRPKNSSPTPQLIIGKLQPGNPPTFVAQQTLDLKAVPDHPDLWELPASHCKLKNGEVYHYWFRVMDSNPDKNQPQMVNCTDPTAWSVDWRLLAPRPSSPEYTEEDQDPAGVVLFQDGQLLPCDPGGETPDWKEEPSLEKLPPNNRLVIYELPTSWTRKGLYNVEIDVGTFRDVLSLVETAAAPANFTGTEALEQGTAHLQELGINALELLPPADSFEERRWGYAPSNYLSPDFDLGFPKYHLSPTANTDLVRLVRSCHQKGIRFFADVVMAFGRYDSYQSINYLDFHVQMETNDPEEFHNSQQRDPYGGALFKYNYSIDNQYNPLSGKMDKVYPARAFMLTFLTRWMLDFHLDGLRIDSIVNIGNWDFIGEFKDHARKLWRNRWNDQGLNPDRADERFLTVGEELAMPMGLLSQGRLDGLWNEPFKRMLRNAIMGKNDDSEPSFEWTVRKIIDCRNLGFADGSQAINYMTSHDVGGMRNERLFNLLKNNGINATQERIQLAFVCLMTAVGVPMILAGEEFGDGQDLPTTEPLKQTDPVNFDRKQDPWRKNLFEYVTRLVKLRTTYDALAVNDTEFIHVDFNDGKQVLAWQRGQKGGDKSAVVVANFSDYTSPNNCEYVVPNWPDTPQGKNWFEITQPNENKQPRKIPPEWVGRESIYPWEAKVYVLM
jgi:pullulanase